MNHPETCIYIGDALARYGFPGGHPFNISRHDTFWNEVQRQGLDRLLTVHEPVQADKPQLLKFHDQNYVAWIEAKSRHGTGFLDAGDTPAFPGVYEAACYVVGSCVDAITRIMQGEHKRVFVPIAGLHHAQRNGASGFCVFNDCGVVIELLLDEYRLDRVAYIDIDAHHGDGVFYAFEANPAVFIVDIHEDGKYLFPGTGHATETGIDAALNTKLNIPVAPGATDAVFYQVWEQQVEDFLHRAQPQFLLFQCGADSVGGDPLAHLNFSPAVHGWACKRIIDIANKYASGRVLAMGGGGYNLRNISNAWYAVVREMVEIPAKNVS